MKINWFGPVGHTGYGIITRFLVPALEELGNSMNIVPIYPDELRVAIPKIKEYVDMLDDNQLDADVGIRLSIGNPFDVMSFHGKKRIFYTMLETTRLPPFWVKGLNTMDQVWTLSKWGANVFKKSGVAKDKIKVVPGGVDTGLFNPYREPLFPKGDKFRFLTVGKWELRKGYDILCHAFSQEFKQNEKVELIMVADSIKMFIENFNIYRELLTLKLPENRADLKIVEGFVPKYGDMGRVYTSVDCFVKPTRGEGWNLPLIEAMATGLPCIVTNWSGHTEYATEKNTILLNDFKLEPVKEAQRLAIMFMKYGKWAEPNIQEVREKMRYAFDNQEEIKKIGKKAERDVQNWTWNEAAKKAMKHLEKLV